jgi:hypothetical protein
MPSFITTLAFDDRFIKKGGQLAIKHQNHNILKRFFLVKR